MGGLPRRHTVLEQVADPKVVVDGGGSLAPRDVQGDLDAARSKAELVATTWTAEGIDAVALAAHDWSLGRPWLRGLSERTGLPVLAANLTCEGASPWPAFRVVERGGHRIGLIGVTSGEIEGCEVSLPADAVRRALAEMGPVDLTIALLPLERPELAPLGALDLDLVVLTASAHRLDLGHALSLQPPPRGKQLGVGEVTWTPGGYRLWSEGHREGIASDVQRSRDAMERLRSQGSSGARMLSQQRRLEQDEARLAVYGDGSGRHRWTDRLVDLDDKVADDPDVLARIQAWKTERAEQAPAAPTAARRVHDGPFAGSDACAACHPEQHRQWAGTPHARALQALVDDGHGTDPACVGCHVTAWRTAGGPKQADLVGAFRDVQCEACHGPGRDHAQDPTRSTVVRSPELSVCTSCHDGDRDGGRFDAATYLPRVQHSTSPVP